HRFGSPRSRGQVGLGGVAVEDVDVLVEEQLHELGGLQELALAAEDAGRLLGGEQDAAAGQREHRHERYRVFEGVFRGNALQLLQGADRGFLPLLQPAAHQQLVVLAVSYGANERFLLVLTKKLYRTMHTASIMLPKPSG
ncbi:hypothetical protein ANANG_G00244480, partial [Anguilla anguilla]